MTNICYLADGKSLLDDHARILVCPVNCRPGVMGAGLARAFAARWPGLIDVHRRAVSHGLLSVGHGHMVWLTGIAGKDEPTGVYLFPTKDDWRNPSRLEWIDEGLIGFSREIAMVSDPDYGERRVDTVAMPALGCGLGGLRWRDVGPLILRTAAGHPTVRWAVYGPLSHS